MAKGKRSNSPKRSRGSRGGKRSPKKSKQGVQKKISKGEAEPAQLHKEVEEPDCECDLEIEAEEPQSLPKMAEEVPVVDVSTVKESLVQFFWDSIEEDKRDGLKSLSQREEKFFFFGTVVAELAKSGKFTAEVESNLVMVWNADEAWIRSFIAGEVEPAKPEEPEAPMEQVENVEEAVEVAETPELEAKEAEVAAEVAPEAPVPEVAADLTEVVETSEVVEPTVEETPEVEDVAMEGAEPAVEEQLVGNVGLEGSYEPQSMEKFVPESAINNENTANVIAEAVKTVASKIGEQSTDIAADGFVPKDLNWVAPSDLA
jgi:S-DNA-T family DNA segregation ATPase FtsK/SpoIIIE